MLFSTWGFIKKARGWISSKFKVVQRYALTLVVYLAIAAVALVVARSFPAFLSTSIVFGVAILFSFGNCGRVNGTCRISRYKAEAERVSRSRKQIQAERNQVKNQTIDISAIEKLITLRYKSWMNRGRRVGSR